MLNKKSFFTHYQCLMVGYGIEKRNNCKEVGNFQIIDCCVGKHALLSRSGMAWKNITTGLGIMVVAK